MYHVSAQGIDERMINVHYYYNILWKHDNSKQNSQTLPKQHAMYVKILEKTTTLNEKKFAFQAKDQLGQKHVQSKLRKERKDAKKEKIEFQFQTGNMHEAWKGLKTLAGHTKPKLNSSNKPANE